MVCGMCSASAGVGMVVMEHQVMCYPHFYDWVWNFDLLLQFLGMNNIAETHEV